MSSRPRLPADALPQRLLAVLDLAVRGVGRQFRPARARREGHESAGRVLGVLLAGLVIAALVNADAMVARAERKPFGSGRDRSLAIWHPVQDVAHVLQISRLRDLGDAFAGNEDSGHLAASPLATTPSAEPAVRPEVRVPTAIEPLQVWVGGDSMMRDLSESVQRLAAPDRRLAVTVHYEISTGLARPDYFDWRAALARDVADTDPEIMVVMFGANDGQGIVAADGTVYQHVTDAGWGREYARRVGAVMDQLRADDHLVLWVLQPPMRDSDFDARMQRINAIYRDEAADRPWVQLVETAPLLGDGSGGFADHLPGPDGQLQDLRQDDGIHLARAGADKVAAALLRLIDEEI